MGRWKRGREPFPFLRDPREELVDDVRKESVKKNAGPPKPVLERIQITPKTHHTFIQYTNEQYKAMTLEEVRELMWHQLGPYESFIFQYAKMFVIPPPLLAVVLINELFDISDWDLFQEDHPSVGGSVGIAQIQISTAKEFELFRPSRFVGGLDIGEQLRRPELAIRSAAKLIRLLIFKMTRNLNNPWQKEHRLTLKDVSLLKDPWDFYKYLAYPNQVARQLRAARLLAGSYNSNEIIIAQLPTSIDLDSDKLVYDDGVKHANNAENLAANMLAPPPMFHTPRVKPPAQKPKPQPDGGQ